MRDKKETCSLAELDSMIAEIKRAIARLETQSARLESMVEKQQKVVAELEEAIAELDSMVAELRRGCARDERLRKVIHEMYEETDKAYLDSLVNGRNTNELWARRETLRELICRAEGEAG